ncbi:transcription factor A, mitochondrial-like [Glandiceps talaboti]
MALPISWLLTRVYHCSKQCFVTNRRYGATLQILRHLGSDVEYPGKPKRPHTPFLRFIQENRPRLEASHGTARKIIAGGAEEWRGLSEDEKQTYVDDYKFEVERYREAMAEFMDNLTEEQKQVMKENKEDKRKKFLAKRKQRNALGQGKPKLPATAFSLYVKEKFAESQDTMTHEDRKRFFSNLASKWNALSEDEKQPYTDWSKKCREQYNIEIKAWEERMIELGQIEMIRESTKKQLQKSGKV